MSCKGPFTCDPRKQDTVDSFWDPGERTKIFDPEFYDKKVSNELTGLNKVYGKKWQEKINAEARRM